MSEEVLSVNDELDFCIERCPHDEENPYTLVHNGLIRDSSISPECRWLIIYLLSNKSGWKISIKQIINHVKGFIGRKSVYKILNEAIESGYMKKEITKKGNLNQHIKYYVSEKPKFKKILRRSVCGDAENGDAEDGHAEKGDYKNNIHKEITSKESNTPLPPKGEVATAPEGEASKPPEIPKKTKTPKVFPEEVLIVAEKMIKILMEKNPVYRPPADMTKFWNQVQYMIEKDKQDIDILIKTFEWAASDNEERAGFKGWQGVICSVNPAETLRKHFAKIHSQMFSMPKRKFSPCSNDAESLKKWEEASKRAIL